MDRPIIFSAPMIQALLAGRKSQTRRIIKPQPTDEAVADGSFIANADRLITPAPIGYAVGDRLYVREAWAPITALTHNDPGSQACADNGFYRADGSTVEGEISRWRPSIHMPRSASRLTLLVTEVRVQPLLDISEEDAAAEGFQPGRVDDGFGPRDMGGGYTIESPGSWASAVGHFQMLWAKLHPDWDGYSSPWVAAVSFTVQRGNIDALPVTP